MEMIILVILILVVILFGIAGGLAQVLPRGDDRTGSYKARHLLTGNEAEFFGRLVAALPDHYIFPQVAMSALIEAASSDKKKAHGDRLRIAQQRVDYVVSDRNFNVVVVVELDDRTHSGAKDQIRDARLMQVNIRTVRFQSKNKPGIDAIRAAVLSVACAPQLVSVPA